METQNNEIPFNDNLLKEWFEKRPTKDVYIKAWGELIAERANITKQDDYDRRLIEKIDEVIQSIQVYLTVATK